MQTAAARLRLQNVPWRKLFGIVLALVGIATAALAYFGYMVAARSEPVVMVAAPIAPGTRVSAEMLEVTFLPVTRPTTLQGVPDVSIVVGQYARAQLSPGQIVDPVLLQATPLDEHIFVNGDLPFEALGMTVFELNIGGISTVTAQDRVNILVLINAEYGRDPAFSLGAIDAPGTGARAVRVLADLNVLHVREGMALIEVTPAQSQYLWALQSAIIPFTGELSRAVSPLGPLRPQDAELPLLQPGAPQAVTP